MKATIREIGRLAGVAKLANPAVVIAFQAIALSKKLAFNGRVDIGGTVYDVAGSNGKLKSFADVDSMVKVFASKLPTTTGDYSVNVKTGVYLMSSIPSDIQAAAAKEVVKLGAAKVAQLAVVAGLDADLLLMAGWENGNPLQVARKAAVAEQKAVIVADIAAIDAEIVVQTALAA